MFKTHIAKLTAVVTSLAAVAIALAPSSAYATTKNGSWYTNHFDCGSTVDVQLHYINDTADNLTRTDGFGVHLSDRTAGIYNLYIDEYVSSGVKVGSVMVRLSDTHTDSMTGISNHSLPWVRPAQKPFALVTVTLSDAVGPYDTSCPVIAFGQ